MADNPLLLGIDIGTSGCKTVLIDSSGNVVEKAVESYPLYIERNGWSEQEPEDWWNAVLLSMKKVLGRNNNYAKRVKGIGLTGQMHGLVLLDKNGNILRRSILWNDQRTAEQCEEVYKKVGGFGKLLEITNNPMLPGYTGGKILWIKKYEPEIYNQASCFLNPKDYIRFKLTGICATDVSDASGTGLFNVSRREWAKELFSVLGISFKLAPEVYESTEITGCVNRNICSELGLPFDTPVPGGGGDAVIQTLGSGVVSDKDLMTTIGTAGIISTTLEKYQENLGGKLQIFCNVIPDTWHLMGVTLSAGSSLRWLRDRFCQVEKIVAETLEKNDYEILTEEASHAAAGSGGLIFLPYLGGERCPYADPNLKAAFTGLSYSTTRAELIRSVMEGVIFSLWDINLLIKKLNMNFDKISTSGGGSQSQLWRQIHADVFQKKVITVNGSREGAAYGAAMVAAVGTGIWDSFKQGVEMMKTENETTPDKKMEKRYQHLYRIYNSLYSSLKPAFDGLAEFEKLY